MTLAEAPQKADAADLDENPQREQSLAMWASWSALALTFVGFAWFHLGNLGNGLQTDELLSAWITQDGLDDTIWRAQRFQGQSAVYFVFLWVWRQLFGSAEWVMRLPSLLAVLAAMGMAVRFGREIEAQIAGIAASVWLFGGASLYLAATTARPYGFVPLFALLSTRALWFWLERGRTRDGLMWAAGLALLVAMTPFAGTLGIVHAVVLWDRRRQGVLRSGWFRYIVLAGLLSAPIAPQVLALANRRDSLVLTNEPTWFLLGWVTVPWIPLCIIAVLGLGLGFARSPEGSDNRFRVFLLWAVLPSLLLFAFGKLGGSAVFLPRYRSVALLGTGLLIGVLVHHLKTVAQPVAIGLIGLLSVVSLAGTADSHHHGWRDITAWVNAETATDADRVLAFHTGLVESTAIDKLSHPTWVPYFQAALEYYPVDAEVQLVPWDIPGAEILDPLLASLFQHETVIVMDQSEPNWWVPVVREAALERGYVETVGPNTGGGTTSVFRRGTTAD